MADPVTWAVMGLAVIGGVVSGIEGMAANRARNTELQANADAAKLNAEIARANADLERRRMDRELVTNRRKYNLLTGETRAQATGLGVFGGSSLDVLADITANSIFDQKSIVDERTSAMQGFQFQSAAEKTRASGLVNAQRGGTMGFIGSVLGGIATAGQIGLAGGVFDKKESESDDSATTK